MGMIASVYLIIGIIIVIFQFELKYDGMEKWNFTI